MLDFDAGKLVLIGIVALIVIGPKDLPPVLRALGQIIGKARKMAGEFQGQFMDAIKEAELDGLHQDFNALKKTTSLSASLGAIADALEKPAAASAPVETSDANVVSPPEPALAADAPPTPPVIETPIEPAPRQSPTAPPA